MPLTALVFSHIHRHTHTHVQPYRYQGFHQVISFATSFSLQKFSLYISKPFKNLPKNFLLQTLEKTTKNIFMWKQWLKKSDRWEAFILYKLDTFNSFFSFSEKIMLIMKETINNFSYNFRKTSLSYKCFF